jgi:tetratricopeptide (TPR) repeat protein
VDPPTSRPSSARPTVDSRAALLCGIALLLVGVIYFRTLNNPFVYDDFRTIVENASIRNPGDLRTIVLHEATRPIANLSFAVDRAIWGPRPFGFHLSNVLLHALNVLLLFAIAAALARDRPGEQRSSPTLIAFIAAGTFAVHPVLTSAVGYISARSEILSGAFLLLAFLCGRHWLRHGGRVWCLLTFTCWVAATLTREGAVLFPVALLAYDRLFLDPHPSDRRRRWRVLHGPMLCLLLALAVGRIAVLVFVENPVGMRFRWSAIPEQAIVLWRYVALYLNLASPAIYHSVRRVGDVWDLQSWAALLTIAVVVAVAWLVRRTDRLGCFGLVWFGAMLAPSLVLPVFGVGEGMAEHRAYVAGCGLFLTVGSVAGTFKARLSRTLAGRVLVYAAIVIGLLSLGARAILRNDVWSDPVALWSEAASLSPDDGLPRMLLAEEFQRRGQYDQAVEEFRSAVRLRPKDSLAYMNLAVSLAALGRFDEATATLEQLRAADPQSTVISTGFGAVAMLSGRPDVARARFSESLQRDPRDMLALQWIALLEEEEAGNPEAALQRCEELQQVSPGKVSSEECIRRNRARVASRRDRR